MKNLKEFITEAHKHVDMATIGDFAKWACLGEMPDGGPGRVTPKDCEGLLANGWFENFDDSDPESGAADIAKFINDNWDKSIKVMSVETPNDWEVSFTCDNGHQVAVYSAAFTTYFGDLDNLEL